MIAVTTRSRARSLRHAAPMQLGTKLIQRDLGAAPACERYTTVVTGPKEVWTLSVWSDADAMRAFMRTGAHAEIMWKQPSWLECYWGMRWRPGPSRAGTWEGDEWTFPPAPAADRAAVGAPLPARWMDAALGQTVPLHRRALTGAVGATYRVKVAPWRLLGAVRDLRRVQRWARSDPDTLTVSLGWGTRGAICLLVVMRSPEGTERLAASGPHLHLCERWGERAWWSTWEADSEFGQWKRKRLREGQLRNAPVLVDVSLPVAASAAGDARRAMLEHLDAPENDGMETLMLLTTELVTNSVRHAGLTAADRIVLQVRRRDDWVRVDVVDRGRRYEPRVPVFSDLDDSSGRGLVFVDRLAERWGVDHESQNRRHWFELRMPPANAPAESLNA